MLYFKKCCSNWGFKVQNNLSDFLITYLKANQHIISEAPDQLPEEPLENVDTVRVRIRGPQGKTVQRTFFTTDTTEVHVILLFT